MLKDIKDSIDVEEYTMVYLMLTRNGLYEKVKIMAEKVKDHESVLYGAALAAKNGFKNVFPKSNPVDSEEY